MNEKKITVVINRPPDFKTAEKLRMAVGLTLEDSNKISVVFIDNGVYSVNGIALDKNPANIEINKSLETLVMLGVTLYAHTPSMEKTGMQAQTHNVSLLSDGAVAGMLGEQDTIIS